jgi:hypothetical protein
LIFVSVNQDYIAYFVAENVEGSRASYFASANYSYHG